MKFTTYYSLESLVASGRRKVIDKTIISFDLFDTLLVRRIHDPDLIKLPVSRYISELARQQGLSWKAYAIQKRRDSIEKKHRAETGRNFVDHEACYPQFMGELLQELFQGKYDHQILAKVTQYELLLENSMLVPRRILVEWIGELVAVGKKIFVISDMYLPASHLRLLLQHAGISELVTEVVSSADTFLAKASGKGYEMIKKKISGGTGGVAAYWR